MEKGTRRKICIKSRYFIYFIPGFFTILALQNTEGRTVMAAERAGG